MPKGVDERKQRQQRTRRAAKDRRIASLAAAFHASGAGIIQARKPRR